MAGSFAACAKESPSMEQPKIKNSGEPVAIQLKSLSSEEEDDYRRAYLNTSFEILRRNMNNNQNVMISPASIMIALSMAEAGANGQTREQMAALWGGQSDIDGQLSYAADILDRLNSSNGVSMHAADSMWINDEMLSGIIRQEYVDFVRDNYDAEVSYLEFDDAAVRRINSWVDDNTDGMIDKIIDGFEPQTAMVLINAIAFDGSWETQYEDYQVRQGTFHNADGSNSTAQMLNGTENIYLENDKATGFVKYYEGGEYAFVVMLPNDPSQSADDLLNDFTGDDFDEFLNSQTHEYEVFTTMPEFEYDWGKSIKETLIDMGMTDAFDYSEADLTGIADFDDDRTLYIGDVIHKTHIEVDATGTRAAAVTAVTLDVAGAIMEENIKYVTCDRPFAYAIVDMTNNTPVFIGSVNEV